MMMRRIDEATIGLNGPRLYDILEIILISTHMEEPTMAWAQVPFSKNGYINTESPETDPKNINVVRAKPPCCECATLSSNGYLAKR